MNTKLFSFFLMIMLMLTACSDKENEMILTADDYFSVKEVTFEGISADQVYTIEFEAPKAWTAELHCLGSWLSADKFWGDAGKAVINLRPKTDNFGITSREATLDIYIDGMETYTIKVYQNSASTNDIQVNGHVDQGIMSLTADETGMEFSDTLWIKSNKMWSLKVDDTETEALSFETDGKPLNGEDTNIMLIVKASYSKFKDSNYEGKFYIVTNEGTAVPITVKASASIGIYGTERTMQDESERTSFQLVDTVQSGHFLTEFYIESNIRWVLGNLPEWIETATDANTITNVTSSGKITNSRKHVSFHLKADCLSKDGKTGVIEFKDMRGEVIKKVNITYAGVGSNYVTNNLSFRAEDPYGNPWGFEAKASAIEPSNEEDFWKEIAHNFDVTTSADYSSIKDAPFHLIMVRADAGIARKQEVKWATLEMGNGAPSMTGDLYTKDIVLRVNDRGDADDKNGVTDATLWRYAFAFIVPLNVTFNDLWDGDKLKQQYANDIVLVSQKNDPEGNYTFGFKEVENNGTMTVPAKGGTLTLNVTPGSYSQCVITMSAQNEEGEWKHVSSDICSMDYTRKEEEISTITFTLSENKGVTNPFTHQTTGAPRHIKVEINAFIGDLEDSKTIFVFYIDQELVK